MTTPATAMPTPTIHFGLGGESLLDPQQCLNNVGADSRLAGFVLGIRQRLGNGHLTPSLSSISPGCSGSHPLSITPSRCGAPTRVS